MQQTEPGALRPRLSPSGGSAVYEKVLCTISGKVPSSDQSFGFWHSLPPPSLLLSLSLDPFTLCLLSSFMPGPAWASI